jgi:hypothetical protein
VDGKKETRRCHNCREKVHLAADCKVVIKCEICGGRHKTIACFEDPRNAHRRPNNWESKLSEAEKKRHFGGEKTMANVEGDGDKHVQWKEVLLANIDGSKGEKEHLEEPSLWVGPYIQKEWLDEGKDSSSSDESDGPPPLVKRNGEPASDVDSSEEDSESEESDEDEDSDYEDTNSVETVSAAELLKECTTNLDDISLNEKELEEAMKELDMSNRKLDWKPPATCTRSKMKGEQKVGKTRSQRDIEYERIYEGAEKLTETLKQIAKNKEAFAKKYGVEDVDEYFHQKAVAFGWEREVDAEDLAKEGLADDEIAYSYVKPTKKRGISRFVKIVHKRSKSG